MKILALFLLSFSAFASEQNIVQQKLSAKDGQDPFVVLKKFHESTGTPAKLDEINSYDIKTDQLNKVFENCASSDFSNPIRINASYLKLVNVEKVIPAVPSNGPLFPGTPEIKIPLITFSDKYSALYPSEAIAMGEQTEIEVSETYGTTLHINLDYLSQNHVEIKKHGDLLSFYLSSYDGQILKNQSYGYCWNE